MKRYFSILCMLALLASSCNTDEQLINEPISPTGRIFTASFEQNDTRTYVEEGNLLRWNAGDQITIFDSNTLNQQYKFDGETGDNGGTFSKVSSAFGTGNDLNCHYAVYPYNKDIKITETGVITANLPAEQSYAENSFGLGANTMVAVTKDVDDTFLKFRNVGGYLKLQLYGDNVTVKSITLTGNNNEKLAGKATITPAYGQSPTLAMSDDATTSITLDCGDGVTLGSNEETATAFWIVVPPTTFESGFDITITDINGKTLGKSTSNKISIKRNIINPMKAFEAKFKASKPANNEIWYTSTDGKVILPNDANVFDANIISNSYENGKGIITFDDEITTIGDFAFRWCNLTSVTIPDGVVSIGNGVFANCTDLNEFKGKHASDDGRCLIANGVLCAFAPSGLTEYTIDDTVIAIGGDSFVNCDKLESVTIGNSVARIGDYAFAYSDALVNVIIPDSVTMIGEAAFFLCQKLESVTIGNNVTTIGKAAFAFCSYIKLFKGKYAYDNGRSLIKDSAIIAYANASGAEYDIPESITSIGDYAFSYCNITKVTIPVSVTAIGEYSFYSSSLSSLYCKAITPPEISGPYSLADTNILSVYIPAESVDIYKATDYWKECNLVGIGNDTEKFSWFNPDQYITYVENGESIEPNADDWYEYSSYIDCPISPFSKIEMKYEMIDDGSTCYLCCRNRARENTSAIYLATSGLVVLDEDEDESRGSTYSWESLNVSKSDRMTLTISFKDKELSINDTPIEYRMNSLTSFRSGYFFSYFRSENDEGTWRVRGEGVPEGSKLYYVKIWDENDDLVYIGGASKALNPKTNIEEYCWRSYYNEQDHLEFAYHPTTHTNYNPYGGGIDQ